MHLSRTLKTGFVAAAVVLATAGASMAATWAWVEQDAKVRANHQNIAPVVNWVEEGQKVQIVGSWGNWYKIKIPGQDGWVKKGLLAFNPWPNAPWPGYGAGYGGGSFCINGDNAQFCISGGY
ncbi:SH3 domain-containing protein [Devosia sp.]|uniref:SH3 domain-containing protein n=1 Tax=Devosia sp. TaxID=1871048 RepID=UPI002F135624